MTFAKKKKCLNNRLSSQVKINFGIWSHHLQSFMSSYHAAIQNDWEVLLQYCCCSQILLLKERRIQTADLIAKRIQIADIHFLVLAYNLQERIMSKYGNTQLEDVLELSPSCKFLHSCLFNSPAALMHSEDAVSFDLLPQLHWHLKVSGNWAKRVILNSQLVVWIWPLHKKTEQLPVSQVVCAANCGGTVTLPQLHNISAIPSAEQVP